MDTGAASGPNKPRRGRPPLLAKSAQNLRPIDTFLLPGASSSGASSSLSSASAMAGSELGTSENQNPNVILCSSSNLSPNCTISTDEKCNGCRPVCNATSASVITALEPCATVNQNSRGEPSSVESSSPNPNLNVSSTHDPTVHNRPPAVLGSVPSEKAKRGRPRKLSYVHESLPSSVRVADTTAKDDAKISKKGVKRKHSIVKGCFDAEVKESLAKAFRSELASLFQFYHEDQKLDLTVALVNNAGRRTEVALLLEESGLPFSSLVANLLLQLKPSRDGQGGNDLTLVSLRSLVLSVGERMCFGTPNPDADVLEDDSDACLWCWEVRDIKLFPESYRSLIAARRRKRRKIAERIAAVSGMITVLTATYNKDEEQSMLEKGEEALLKTESEDSIRAHFSQWKSKMSAKGVVKEVKSREKQSLKDQERHAREIEKERRRLDKEEEKEKKRMEKEEERKKVQEERERERIEKEKDKFEKEATKQRLKEALQQEKDLKKHQEEVEKDQKRKEKEEADLKKQSALKKQANIMDRFLQSKRDKELISRLPSETIAVCHSSGGTSLHEKIVQDMDKELTLRGERSISDLLSSHVISWKEHSSLLSSRKSARWGQRRVPKMASVSDLRLQEWPSNSSEGADNTHAGFEPSTGGGIKRSRAEFEQCEVGRCEGDWDDSGVSDFSDLVESGVVEDLEDKPSLRRTKRRKLLQFDKSYRPAYYGTFSKKSQVVRPRNPLKMDSNLDYENDSDEEWEEEDPGESLSDCEKDEEDEKPDVDEDEEAGNGFVVPDGYLSESEVAHVDESDSESDSEQSQRSPSKKTVVNNFAQHDGNQNLLKFARQCKVLEQLTNQALQRNRPYIICNFFPSRCSTLAHKTDRTCLEALKMCCMSNDIHIEVPEDPQLQEVAASDGKKPIKRSKMALPETAVCEMVEILMSSTHGLKWLMDLLSTKFPMAARSQLKAKIKEIADFVDNHWQVKEEVLEQLGITPACAQVANTTDPVSKSPSTQIKPITKFFSKRCLPPETAGLDDKSPLKGKENLCAKGNVGSDENLLQKEGSPISLAAGTAMQ